MGHCYEFALDIVPGCGHAMTVSDSGGICECTTCGAVCGGRFEGCAAVLERPGYVPVNAPRWAIERTFSRQATSPPASAAHDTDATDDEVLDLIALRDQARRVADSAIDDASRDLRLALEGATSGIVARVRNELETHVIARSDTADLDDLLADIRSDLARATAQQTDTVDHIMKAIEQLALQGEADRVTLRAVVEGLDRLARRVSRLHSS